MRNELLYYYNAAIDTKDKDVIECYQRAKDRIAPMIVIDLLFENEELQNNTRASDEVIRGLVEALERQARCSDHLLKRIPVRDYAETCGETEQALAKARKHLQSEK